MPRTIYRADDGKEFEFQAYQHEAFVANEDAFYKAVKGIAQSDDELEACDEGTVERFVVRHAVALLDLLKRMAKRVETDEKDDEVRRIPNRFKRR